MSNTLVLYAHPHPSKSRVTRQLLQTVTQSAQVRVHSLYQLYPDFDIDVHAEQQALLEADTLIWLAPVHWYGLPSLLKHWIDMVLTYGWAYGQGGDMLRDKRVWWITSAGAGNEEYTAQGSHLRPFVDFVAPVEGIARYCGMQWLPPFIVHAFGHANAAQQAAILRALGEQCAGHLAPEGASAAHSAEPAHTATAPGESA